MQMHIQGKKIIHSIEQGGITCPPNFFQSEQADDPKAVKNTRRTDKICSAAFTKSVFPSHQDEEKKIFFFNRICTNWKSHQTSQQLYEWEYTGAAGEDSSWTIPKVFTTKYKKLKITSSW